MHCIVHLQSEAVGICGICGAGLCHDCFTGTFYTWNDKPLCPSCNVRLVSELAAEARAEASSARFRVLLFVVALVVGAAMAIGSGQLEAAFCLFGLGGIPTMWRLTRPSLGETVEYAVQDGVEHAFGHYEGSLFRMVFRFALRIFLVLVLSQVVSFVLFFVALWKWRKAARQAAELEADLAAMQEAGWRAAGSLKDTEPADPKTAARIRARHFAGPWKRGAPAPVSEAAPVPAPVARAAAVPPASVPPPSPPSPGESASARLAARMAAVDARIAARKAAIESSKR